MIRDALAILGWTMALPFLAAYDRASALVGYKRAVRAKPLWVWRLSDATIQAIAVAITSICGVLGYLLGHKHGGDKERARNGHQTAKSSDCGCE